MALPQAAVIEVRSSRCSFSDRIVRPIPGGWHGLLERRPTSLGGFSKICLGLAGGNNRPVELVCTLDNDGPVSQWIKVDVRKRNPQGSTEGAASLFSAKVPLSYFSRR